MKKVIVGLMTALLAFSAFAATTFTETWTNELGQVFTDATMEGLAAVPAYATYALDERLSLTVISNVQTNTITAYTTYLTGTTAESTNVTFMTPFPVGKEFKLICVSTADVTIATSASFDVGASAVALGATDVLTMYAYNTGVCYRVSNADN